MPTPGLDWIVNGLFHPSSKGQQPVSSPPPLEQRHERAAASSPTPLSSSPPAGLASTPPDHTIGNRRRTLSNTSTDSEEPEEAALVASAPTSYSNAVVVGVDSSQHSADAVSHALANAQPGDTVHVCYCYSPLQGGRTKEAGFGLLRHHNLHPFWLPYLVSPLFSRAYNDRLRVPRVLKSAWPRGGAKLGAKTAGKSICYAYQYQVKARPWLTPCADFKSHRASFLIS